MASKGWCCGVVLLLACSACGGGGDADVDAAPPDAGPCNTVANVGDVVNAVRVAEEAPARNGGTLVDGTYVVTSYRGYTGAGGSTVAPGIQIEATSVNEAGHYDYVDSGNASAGSYA